MATIEDFGKELFEKGAAALSDIADAAGVLAVKAKIKAQIFDQDLELESLMKQLGQAVYEEVKLDSRYTDAHPDIFEKIEEVKARKQALEEEYERLEAESKEKEQAESQEEPVEAEIVAVEEGAAEEKASEEKAAVQDKADKAQADKDATQETEADDKAAEEEAK